MAQGEETAHQGWSILTKAAEITTLLGGGITIGTYLNDRPTLTLVIGILASVSAGVLVGLRVQMKWNRGWISLPTGSVISLVLMFGVLCLPIWEKSILLDAMSREVGPWFDSDSTREISHYVRAPAALDRGIGSSHSLTYLWPQGPDRYVGFEFVLRGDTPLNQYDFLEQTVTFQDENTLFQVFMRHDGEDGRKPDEGTEVTHMLLPDLQRLSGTIRIPISSFKSTAVLPVYSIIYDVNTGFVKTESQKRNFFRVSNVRLVKRSLPISGLRDWVQEKCKPIIDVFR